MQKRIISFFIVLLLLGTTVLQVSGECLDNHITELNKLHKQTNNIDFDQEIEILMRLARTPSLSACIIKEDSIVWSNAYGYSNVYKQESATIDTLYLIASISKSITATAILQLYEQGYCDLDDDVNMYLPFEVRNPNHPDDPITFRMLLAHQSSFCYNVPLSIYMKENMFLYHYFFFWIHYKDIFKSEFYEDDFYPWIKEIIIPGGIYYHPEYWGNYQPGEQFYYSGIGYVLLGYLIELLSNQTFEEYCKEHIFDPLEMFNTSFYLENLPQDQFAIPYVNLKGILLPLTPYEFKSYNPPAGLYSTVSDLSHFLIAHMNDGVYDGVRILEEDTIYEMHTVHYPESKPRYGLGWQITDTIMGHSGSVIGYVSFMFSRIDEKKGIVLFINENNLEGMGLLFNGIYENFERSIRIKIFDLLWEKADEYK